jgi:hypothetical protein
MATAATKKTTKTATTSAAKKQPKKSARKKIYERAKELQDAYNAGYASGWDDGSRIKTTAGKKLVANTGYHDGMKAKSKTNKAIQRANKGRAVGKH